MTHTTFHIIEKTNKQNTFCESTDYSKILDNLIATNIAECNPYLNATTPKKDFISLMMKDSAKKHGCSINTGCYLKMDPEFIKAANALAEYSKKKASKKLPFILGKTYKLIDGTPIIFYNDEIQIGFDLFSYDDFKNITFLKGLPSSTKKQIINIYTSGANINININ